MHEIEHRYLLSSLPPTLEDIAFTITKVKNVYFVTDEIQERFTKRYYYRHHKYSPGTKLFKRTVKIGHGIDRLEFKDNCSKNLYRSMKRVKEATHLRKVRYRISQKLENGEKFIWEVDTFLDRELFLAEVEVPSIEHPVVVPDWLQPHIEREVTEEIKYEGASLAF